MSIVRHRPTTKAGREITIRWMIRVDMPTVLAIEKQSYTPPWTENNFIKKLRRRCCIGLVAEIDNGTQDGEVAGYMVYDLHKNYLHLLRMAVAPTWRRQGVARSMLDKLVFKLSTLRRRSIRTDVCDSNLDAHLFLRARCFKATGVIRGELADTYQFRYLIGSELE